MLSAETMRNVLSRAIQNAPRGTQARMAIALGVVPQTVNKWAKGINGPEPEMFGPIEE